MKKTDAYHQILSIAEELIQTKGFNAFSYRDIAEQIGIKTSSIHYYFPTKTDLAKAVVQHHIDSLSIELENLIQNHKLSSRKKMDLFLTLLIQKTYLTDRKMCLGGMLASDVLTLPQQIQQEVKIFFTHIEEWLKRLLSVAIQNKEMNLEKKEINNEVTLILSSFEGALLLSRLFHENHHLNLVRKNILSLFE